jgi:capsular polysaccharide export protein
MKLRISGLEYILITPIRVVARIFSLVLVFIVYVVQLWALALKQKKLASHLLALGARLVLYAMGVCVVISVRDKSLDGSKSRPVIYLYNHQNPLDVFVVQGYLRIPSITTAGLHLGLIFPWFSKSALNAGHVLMDHLNVSSRGSAVYKSSEILRRYGAIIIAPNGSLKTTIFQRVSASAWVLAKKHNARIVPWTFVYKDLWIPEKDLYDPFKILVRRIIARPSTINCYLGTSTDLNLPSDTRDREGFSQAVKLYYLQQQESG